MSACNTIHCLTLIIWVTQNLWGLETLAEISFRTFVKVENVDCVWPLIFQQLLAKDVFSWLLVEVIVLYYFCISKAVTSQE